MKNQKSDLVAHITIPPPRADIETITTQDYQMQEVILGKSTKDTAKVLTIMGLKKVFHHLDQGEEELQFFRKQNDILRYFVKEVAGPIDPDYPEIVVSITLEKWAPTLEPSNLFLDTCKRCHHSFAKKGVEIIATNMHLLHNIQKNGEKLAIMVNQDFGLMDKVSTWTNDLEAL